MYAYCNNNPIMLVDHDGRVPFLAITAIVGAVAGAAVGGYLAAKSGKNIWAGIGIGAVGGALLGLGIGAGLSMISGAGALATTGKVFAGLSSIAGTYSDKITKIFQAGSKNKQGASNAINAIKLKQQLLTEQASSIFEADGMLKQGIINNSKPIINGLKLGNPSVISELTSDGSTIDQWAKMSTTIFQGPQGKFSVHFYMNTVTKVINIYEMKCKIGR